MNFNFKRLVIWGLRSQFHTHRFIHLGFYTMGKKLGLETIWLDNDKKFSSSVKAGDMVISVNVAGSEIPIIRGVKYVLHNFNGSLNDKLAQLHTDNFINLQVYTNDTIAGAEKIGNCTYFNSNTRTLIQPWGTPLLPKEFLNPRKLRFSKIVIWVGSVWNNELNQGNVKEYKELKQALNNHNIKLIKLNVSEALNKVLISRSKIAPSIGGQWQVENGYLPCRMFKNITFGQVGSTNINEFNNVFGNSMVYSHNISEIVTSDLSLTESQRYDLIKIQQEMIVPHTYKEKIQKMAMCFQ